MFRLIDEVHHHETLHTFAEHERERRALGRLRVPAAKPVRRRAASALRTLADHLDSQPSAARVPSPRFEAAE
ncbi:MAG: hypothetical protein U0547_01850 [Dehalococcoidia bacterium]